MTKRERVERTIVGALRRLGGDAVVSGDDDERLRAALEASEAENERLREAVLLLQPALRAASERHCDFHDPRQRCVFCARDHALLTRLSEDQESAP